MKTRVIQGDPGEGGAAAVAAPLAPWPASPAGAAAASIGGAVAAAIGVAALAGGGALVGVARDPARRRRLLRHRRDRAQHADARAGVRRPGRRPRRAGWLSTADAWATCGVGAAGRATDPSSSASARRTTCRLPRRRRRSRRPTSATAAARPSSPAPGRPARPRPRASGRPRPPGTGSQTVVWPMESGDWSAVVMNADGAAGVRVETAARREDRPRPLDRARRADRRRPPSPGPGPRSSCPAAAVPARPGGPMRRRSPPRHRSRAPPREPRHRGAFVVPGAVAGARGRPARGTPENRPTGPRVRPAAARAAPRESRHAPPRRRNTPAARPDRRGDTTCPHSRSPATSPPAWVVGVPRTARPPSSGGWPSWWSRSRSASSRR